MTAFQNLPDGYKELFSVDLQKDKKTALIINALSFVIAVIMAILLGVFVPLMSIYDDHLWMIFIKLGVLALGMVLYFIFHELTHGVTMKIFGAKKIKYGFTGLYAYAGSDDYYTKVPYIVIALAPVVLWGIIFTILCFIVPYSWIWIIYFIQIINIFYSYSIIEIFIFFKGIV